MGPGFPVWVEVEMCLGASVVWGVLEVVLFFPAVHAGWPRPSSTWEDFLSFVVGTCALDQLLFFEKSRGSLIRQIWIQAFPRIPRLRMGKRKTGDNFNGKEREACQDEGVGRRGSGIGNSPCAHLQGRRLSPTAKLGRAGSHSVLSFPPENRRDYTWAKLWCCVSRIPLTSTALAVLLGVLFAISCSQERATGSHGR